jgi:hypothetical protein
MKRSVVKAQLEFISRTLQKPASKFDHRLSRFTSYATIVGAFFSIVLAAIAIIITIKIANSQKDANERNLLFEQHADALALNDLLRRMIDFAPPEGVSAFTHKPDLQKRFLNNIIPVLEEGLRNHFLIANDSLEVGWRGMHFQAQITLKFEMIPDSAFNENVVIIGDSGRIMKPSHELREEEFNDFATKFYSWWGHTFRYIGKAIKEFKKKRNG